jgi:hypothetical protein
MDEKQLREERDLLRREFADLEREYQTLASDPSHARQRQHAGRLLDHIARLHGLLSLVGR